MLSEPARSDRIESGEVKFRHSLRAAFFRPEVLLAIRIIFTKTGSQQNDGAVRDLSVLLFPVFKIFHADQVIRIRRALLRDVDHDRRTYELVQRNLKTGK